MVAVFDGHNDALTRDDHAGIVSGRPTGHLDLPRMRTGGVHGGIFAVCVPSEGDWWVDVDRTDGVQEIARPQPVAHSDAAAFAARAAGRLLALERAGDVRIARTVEDLDAAAVGDGPPAAILHLEGAEAIDPELEALELWYAAGLRSLGPVWSRDNAFGHGVPFIFPSSPDTGPGLTAAGHALVRRCAELGILVDLSHLNEQGFWDVARAELGPLVASHSGVHALSPASRNLVDAQLDAIGSSEGLVGIIYGCKFVRPDMADDPDTPLELIARHAAYVAERIGVEHVALGSDFDGTTIPDQLGDVAGVPKLLDALSSAGFGRDDIAAIAWGNWRRVFGAWWT
ncbi:MAG: dipeptidase [Solirubrobacteraceae bacterium]